MGGNECAGCDTLGLAVNVASWAHARPKAPWLTSGAMYCGLIRGRSAQDAARKGWLRTSTLGSADARVVASIMADIASGMAALHAAGVVHGELSGGARPPRSRRRRAWAGGRSARSGAPPGLPDLALKATAPRGRSRPACWAAVRFSTLLGCDRAGVHLHGHSSGVTCLTSAQRHQSAPIWRSAHAEAAGRAGALHQQLLGTRLERSRGHGACRHHSGQAHMPTEPPR
jgi:hypothetical protein